jgi:beta-phosphoglucomutase
MAKIKGLIFDLDGTLTLTQEFHYEALHEVFLNDYGIDYTQAEDQELFSGKGSKYTCEQILKNRGKNPTASDIEKCAARKKEVYERILAGKEIIPVPGIKDFLDSSKKEGLKMIVATGNKPEATKIILERAGILGYFDVIVSQANVKNQKPAPDLFLLAAEKLNAAPEECVVFEDSINGIEAAKAGNIPCVALTTGTAAEKLIAAGALETIKDYNDPKLKKLIYGLI